MNIVPVAQIVADLKFKHGEIETEKDEEQLFYQIADYGKYLSDNKIVLKYSLPFYQDAQNDVDSYQRAYQEFIVQLKNHLSDLLPQINNASTLKEPLLLTEHLENLSTGLQSNRVSCYYGEDSGKTSRLYDSYEKIVNSLQKKEMEFNLAKHYSAEKRSLRLWEYFQKVKDEWRKYRRTREVNVWWAHYNIILLAQAVLDFKEDKQYFEEDSKIIADFRDEFKRFVDGDTNIHLLNKNRFEKWIDRLHNFLTLKIGTVSQPQQEEGVESKVLCIKKDGEIEYLTKDRKKRAANFTKGNNDYEVLMFFVNHHGKIFQTHELANKIELRDPKRGAEGVDPKERIRKAISAIRDKLHYDVITSSSQGYKLDCRVVRG